MLCWLCREETVENFTSWKGNNLVESNESLCQGSCRNKNKEEENIKNIYIIVIKQIL